MTPATERCSAEYPGTRNLSCLKPEGHEGRHATCLGYHPEPYDEWEWAEWEPDRVAAQEEVSDG